MDEWKILTAIPIQKISTLISKKHSKREIGSVTLS